MPLVRSYVKDDGDDTVFINVSIHVLDDNLFVDMGEVLAYTERSSHCFCVFGCGRRNSTECDGFCVF